jgi:ADP-ribose pyrophosphatase
MMISTSEGENMAFEVIDSKVLFEGRVFDVRQDRVRLPDGREMTVDVVDHRGAVALIPLDEEGNILFIRQYRYPAGEELLELPAGVIDEGEDREACAHREIREETGMAADKIHLVGEYYLAPGYSTEYLYVYLATGLRDDPLEGDEDEDIRVEKLPIADALRMAESGQIHDGKTLAALLCARQYLK